MKKTSSTTIFNQRLLACLSKLQDNATIKTAHSQIRGLLSQYQLSEVLSIFHTLENDDNAPEKSKKEYVKVYSAICQVYGTMLLDYFQRFLTSLLKKMQYAETVAEVITSLMGVIVEIDPNYQSNYVQFLLETLATNQKNEAVGSCLKSVIRTSPIVILQSFEEYLVDLTLSKASMSKNKVSNLQALLSLILSLQQAFSQQQKVCPVLSTYMKSEDWNTRRVAIDIFCTMLMFEGQAEQVISQKHLVKLVEEAKYDKIKNVRDVATTCIGVLKKFNYQGFSNNNSMTASFAANTSSNVNSSGAEKQKKFEKFREVRKEENSPRFLGEKVAHSDREGRSKQGQPQMIVNQDPNTFRSRTPQKNESSKKHEGQNNFKPQNTQPIDKKPASSVNKSGFASKGNNGQEARAKSPLRQGMRNESFFKNGKNDDLILTKKPDRQPDNPPQDHPSIQQDATNFADNNLHSVPNTFVTNQNYPTEQAEEKEVRQITSLRSIAAPTASQKNRKSSIISSHSQKSEEILHRHSSKNILQNDFNQFAANIHLRQPRHHQQSFPLDLAVEDQEEPQQNLLSRGSIPIKKAPVSHNNFMFEEPRLATAGKTPSQESKQQPSNHNNHTVNDSLEHLTNMIPDARDFKCDTLNLQLQSDVSKDSNLYSIGIGYNSQQAWLKNKTQLREVPMIGTKLMNIQEIPSSEERVGKYGSPVDVTLLLQKILMRIEQSQTRIIGKVVLLEDRIKNLQEKLLRDEVIQTRVITNNISKIEAKDKAVTALENQANRVSYQFSSIEPVVHNKSNVFPAQGVYSSRVDLYLTEENEIVDDVTAPQMIAKSRAKVSADHNFDLSPSPPSLKDRIRTSIAQGKITEAYGVALTSDSDDIIVSLIAQTGMVAQNLDEVHVEFLLFKLKDFVARRYEVGLCLDWLLKYLQSGLPLKKDTATNWMNMLKSMSGESLNMLDSKQRKLKLQLEFQLSRRGL